MIIVSIEKYYENQVHEEGVEEFKYLGYGFQKHWALIWALFQVKPTVKLLLIPIGTEPCPHPCAQQFHLWILKYI